VTDITVPVREQIHRATITLGGRREFTRTAAGRPLLAMVQRDEFDAALCHRATAAGAVRAPARHGPYSLGILRGGTAPAGRWRGDHRSGGGRADGSAGVTGRHVGVELDQVDLGLEIDVPTPEAEREHWRGRLLIDWGPLPGSYGWVFPKGDLLTVGVIAGRGRGEETRSYMDRFRARLGLTDVTPVHDSGHLTRCRSERSPLRRGRVLVAGDAAGLLDPWTREGISFALRSGALAGAAAAAGDTPSYESTVEAALGQTMRAGRRFLRVFERHPTACHAALRTPPGWREFARLCRGETDLADFIDRRAVRAALAILA
jgi:flavin-dependent dehydrogenase